MFYLLTLFHYVWGKAPEIWGMFFCQWQAGYEVDPSLDMFEDRSMDSAPDGVFFIYKLTHEIWMGYNLSSVPTILSIFSAMWVTYFF